MKHRFLTTYHAAAPFLVFILLLATAPQNAVANPPNSNYGRFSLGLNGGPMVFLGDVKRYMVFPAMEELRPGARADFNYRITGNITLTLSGLYGKLAGKIDDDSFKTDIKEVSLFANILLFSTGKTQRFQTHVIVGGGYISYSAAHTNQPPGSTPFITTNNNSKLALPAGLKLSYRLNNRWLINLQSINTVTFVDDLDTVVQNRGDVYNTTFLGLEYRFGKQPQRYPARCAF